MAIHDAGRSTRKCVGIDFDNTLINYDQVFLAAAMERGFVAAGFNGSKRAIRDAIRQLPDGELSWQKLQGYVYGVRIADAVLVEGADVFLQRCRDANCRVTIISHKTEYGHYNRAGVNLRKAAFDWMETHGFFAAGNYCISPEHVYFEDTRAAKLARIAASGAAYFIDDLEEVLTDPDFPPGVTRVLFAEEGGDASCTRCSSWRKITEVVFGDGS